MKVAFATLGCRVNIYDTQAMAHIFETAGHEIVEFKEIADVYIINTCTVTSMSDKKSRQIISKAKKTNKNAVIAVVGCYAQVASDEIAKIEGVNIVLGSRNKGDVLIAVEDYILNNETIINVKDLSKDDVFEDISIEKFTDKSRGFLKIQDGCNNFCSYCLIPYSRGRVASKDRKKVIEEIKLLAKNDVKEIVLSGIHIASYGMDFEEKFSLVDLLNEIDLIEGIERVRIGSIDPSFFTDEVTNLLGNVKKLCPHFHLSLQSGSNTILKKMNRHYTAEKYIKSVEFLREKFKDVSITTDIIVGFPSESENEFNETYEFLKKIKLTKIHVFKYSRRKGTKAFDLKDDVSNEEKNRRSKILIELSEEYEKEFINTFLNKELSVLFEEENSGFSENYIKIKLEEDTNYKNEIKSVIVEKIDGLNVFGRVK